jgi:hypothetical protein
MQRVVWGKGETVGPVAVGIDLGTTNTVAVLRLAEGRCRPILFDGAPLMPSAVYLDPSGTLVAGRDAELLAAIEPSRFEPNPKRRVDDASVLLGDHEVPVRDLLAAVLRTVARGTLEAAPALPPAVLTHPASWGQRRRTLLAEAAALAGWPYVRLMPEPVAAGQYLVGALRHEVQPGDAIAVFDFGAGTLDIAVLRREQTGFRVIGSGGREDMGGLDIDAALVAQLGALLASTAPDAWARLQRPSGGRERRDRRQFWLDVRAAKEMLSRTSSAPVAIPGTDTMLHLTRDELERAVRPMLHDAAQQTATIIRRAGVEAAQLRGVLLVGGSSRVPLIGRLLHAELGVPPIVLEQPELPVAEGAVIEEFPASAEWSQPVNTFPGTMAPGTMVPGGAAYPDSAALSSGGLALSEPVSGPPVSPPAADPWASAAIISAPPGYEAGPVSGPPAGQAAGPVSGPPAGPVSGPPAGPVSGPPATLPTAPSAGPPAGPPSAGRASVPSPAAPAPATGRKRRRALIAGVAAVLVLLGGSATAWYLAIRPDDSSTGGPTNPAVAWKRLAALPVQLEGAAVAAYQKKVYVAGGLLPPTGAAEREKSKRTFVYDPATDSWSNGPDLPRPISHATLVATNVSLYFMGGWILEGGSKQVLRLDAAAGQWVDDTPMPETRVGGAAAFDGTRIVYAGGTRADETASDDVWGFENSTWTPIGKLTRGRQKLAAASDRAGLVWIVAGGDQKSGAKYSLVERVEGGRVIGDTSRTPPAVDGGTAIHMNGSLCALGGRGGTDDYPGWWCDRPGLADSLPDLQPRRAGLGLAVLDRTVYVVGGYGLDFDGTDRVESFTIPNASSTG